MNDFTALLGTLGTTCQELEEIKLEQVKDHDRLSKSFEQALLSILRQEQSILTQVEAEHNQLKKRLTSLHRDNEKALHEGVSEINSMVHQISTLSSQLNVLKDSKDNSTILEEIQEKVSKMFTRKKSILIRLKKVHFTPCRLQTPSLGNITYEEQTFGFSIPYVERRSYELMSSTKTLLSDETAPWEDPLSDTTLVVDNIVHNQKDKLTQGDIKEGESGKTLGKLHHAPKKLRRENGISRSKFDPRRKWPEKGKTESEDTVLSPRTVAKIKICAPQSSMLTSWDSSTEQKTVKVYREETETLGLNIDARDENVRKYGPEAPEHIAEWPISPSLMQNTRRNQALLMSADVNSATVVYLPERKPFRVRDISSLISQSSTSPSTRQVCMSPPKLGESFEDCTQVSDMLDIREEMLDEDITGLSSPCASKEQTCLVINQEQLSRTSQWINEEHVTKSQQYRENEHPTSRSKINMLSLATNSPAGINLSFSGTIDTERHPQLSNSSNQDTLFRATAAFVYENDSDNSDDGPQLNAGNGKVDDPNSFRAVAIQASRIPSGKQNGSKGQLSRWTSVDSDSKMEDSPMENYTQNPEGNLRSQTERDTIQVIQSNQSFEDSSRENRNDVHSQYDHLMRSNKNSIHQGLSLSSRSPSPTESIKSSYTFIIESPRNYRSSHGKNRADSNLVNAELDQRVKRSPPVISSSSESQKKKPQLQTFMKKQLPRSLTDSCNDAETKTGAATNGTKESPKRLASVRSSELGHQKTVSRSNSMPFIEKIPKQLKVIPSNARHTQSVKERRDSASSTSSCRSNPRTLSNSVCNRAPISRSVALKHRRRPTSANFQQQPQRVRSFSKSESNLQGSPLEEDEAPYMNRLIGQFCKFGSGRTELNLPHGIHSTPLGSLYVVDYGNRRVQVLDTKGSVLQQITLEPKNYFDVAVNNKGLVALTNSTDRTVEVYSKHGKLLQIISKNLSAPRGITTNFRDEFVVADMRQGTVSALTLELTTGRQVENTTVPGFNKPYLVSSNSLGLIAVSERGFDGGCCVKVLDDDWKVLRIVGLTKDLGPVLFNPWGVCIDSEGNVLVADWGQTHSVIHYPVRGPARAVVTEGLSSPRGLALFQDCHLVVADSLHNCIKVFWYKW